MIISVCGSMTASPQMVAIEQELIKLGHEVILPAFTKEYALLNSGDEMHAESAKNKIEHDLLRKYYSEIEKSDAALIVNIARHDIDNYIGGNSLIEMAFALILDKPIYLLNPIPQMSYTDEIIAMQPIIINGDLSLIK